MGCILFCVAKQNSTHPTPSFSAILCKKHSCNCPRSRFICRFFRKKRYALWSVRGELVEPRSSPSIYGPLPAPLQKRAGMHRMQLLLSAPNRRILHARLDLALPLIHALPEARKVRWSLDVDPQELWGAPPDFYPLSAPRKTRLASLPDLAVLRVLFALTRLARSAALGFVSDA